MQEPADELRCFDCGRSFRSLRALHAHESLTEVPEITKKLCDNAPALCMRNWISGRCETHTEEARLLVQSRQRLRYAIAGKKIPKHLNVDRRRPAIARLMEAYNA